MKLVHGNRRQRVVASEKQRGLTRKGHKRGLWGITGISVSCLGEHHVRTLQWKIQDLSFLLYVNDNSLKLKKKKNSDASDSCFQVLCSRDEGIPTARRCLGRCAGCVGWRWR